VNPVLVVNPAALRGRGAEDLDALSRALEAELGAFDRAFTSGPGDAVRLAREASAAGAPLVVAVGGDGTASEVVDGLLGAPPPAAAFGFVPRGTGGDLARTLGLPRDAAAAARLLARGEDRACDAGRVEHLGHDGAAAVRHFVNVAGFGLAGRVVALKGRIPRALGGRATYLLAGAAALVGWVDARIAWRADGGAWREDSVSGFSVCNGRFFGGGMLVAPHALIDDGAFDVVVWRGLGLRDLALRRRRLYDGSHLTLPGTESLRARIIEAEPLGGRVLLDVDGEAAGTLPVRITMLPRALRVRAPARS
jgi:YegS/Rv2252/BmrU family lipid kinase